MSFISYRGIIAVMSVAAVLAPVAVRAQTSAAPLASASASAAASSADYVKTAGISDLFEIASSRVALEKSKSAAVKDFARMMVKDHTKSTQILKSAVAKGTAGLALPMALDAAHEMKLKALQAANGDDFDKLYLQTQKTAHTDALALHQGYAKSGDDPALRAAAAEIVPVVSMHLEHVTSLAAKAG